MAWPWDIFDPISQTVQEGLAFIPWAMADIAVQLLNVVMYPVIYGVNLFLVMTNAILYPFISLVNNLLAFSGSIGQLVHLFDNVFPSEWTFLLMAGITINIILRIYKMVPLVGRG